MGTGNIIVGQSGGPTAAINSSLAGVFDAAKNGGAAKVYGMVNGIEGFLDEKIVDLRKQIRSNYELKLLMRTPSSFLGSCRFKLPGFNDDDFVYKKLFSLLDKYEIEHFFYIGGNDSMDTIQKLSHYARQIGSQKTFIGIPKTIDNDLAVTDHTPGYGSAAKFIGTISKEIIRDSLVYDMNAITVVEIMGRNAGWLTAASALSKADDCEGPDLIYLPEYPFETDRFIEAVANRQKDKPSMMIAVSEGIKSPGGRYISDLANAHAFEDSFGHKILTGTASYLASSLTRALGCKTRAVELNTLQRSASHFASHTDVEEAFAAGEFAYSAALEGKSSEMVIFERISNAPYEIRMSTCDIDRIANVEKTIDPCHITSGGTYVSDELTEYIRPLIQGEVSLIMDKGLPKHLILKK